MLQNLSSALMTSEDVNVGPAVAGAILGLSFLVGAPGNLLVIWTILRHVRKRSHTVVLILHLAAADLLVLITLPLWIYSLLYSWVFGEASCKVLVYVVSVCMFSSIFFITLMSVERFVSVWFPFQMMGGKFKRAMGVCPVALWLLALPLGVPTAIFQTLTEVDGAQQCLSKDFGSVSYSSAVALLLLETLGGFVVPFIILTVCYCLVAVKLRKMRLNNKPKSMFLVHAVVIAFLLCWLPYHIISIIDFFCIFGPDSEHECQPQIVVYTSGALVFISSSVNPVLYTFFASNFQEGLNKSRLVQLFQEMSSYTSRPKDSVVLQQSGQKVANTQQEKLNP